METHRIPCFDSGVRNIKPVELCIDFLWKELPGAAAGWGDAAPRAGLAATPTCVIQAAEFGDAKGKINSETCY